MLIRDTLEVARLVAILYNAEPYYGYTEIELLIRCTLKLALFLHFCINPILIIGKHKFKF